MIRTFLHKPHIGDVLYSLPVIRQLGGGTLYLDCSPRPDYRGPLLRSLTFLRRQSYLEECRLYAGEEIDTDLDHYRDPEHSNQRPVLTLIERHFRGVGLDMPNELESWLTAAPAERSRMGKEAAYPVLAHRSPRYHGSADYSFLSNVKPDDLFCVGYPEEAAFFVDTFGATWLQTPTLDRLASVVNACTVFVGNQSSPLALAAGLGKARMLEEFPVWPNCTLGHENEVVLTADADENFARLCQLGYRPA